MAGTPFFCCSDRRRFALQQQPELNGIDYLEVADLDPADLDPTEAAEYASLPVKERDRLLWQRKLTVFFVNPLIKEHTDVLTDANLRIEGGERTDSRNLGATVLSTTSDSVVLKASQRGDFSTYRLRIVISSANLDPPAVIDPLLAAVDFSFKVECPTEFDCQSSCNCPPTDRPSLDLDYLARDYASFRRLLLDRITALSPEWRERHAPDLGIALVELIAYAADYLSYRQDAVATEAYLGTARKRVSVRRHARLVNYPMHEGCNARVWVQVVLDPGVPTSGITLPTGGVTKFLTRVAAGATLDDASAAEVMATQRPEVFELLVDPGSTLASSGVPLYPQHNSIPFYTWGASDCCLPKGATRATLAGRFDKLQVGDVLIFKEMLGPRTGDPGDADPSHRHAVRLTRVAIVEDPLGGQFLAPAKSSPVEVTEIEWASPDALPFPLCVSAEIEDETKTKVPTAISAALGNIVLADHGRSIGEPLVGAVPVSTIKRPNNTSCGCESRDPVIVPARYTPRLAQSGLTHAAPYDASKPAWTAMHQDIALAVPAIQLASTPSQPWSVRRDLLGSSATAADFVVELESDGVAQLRFGDGRHGMRPPKDTTFQASYRVGNGTRGNVGRDAISHIVTGAAGIAEVSNPLPATGGIDPEALENVRRFAPVAFRTQERAVTEDDYARMAERHPQVQRAAATLRWTGSWRTVFVTVDPFASKDRDTPIDPPLPAQLEPYRMAGHDLEIDTPRYVPLEISMQVCAKREYFRSDVKQALLQVFSTRLLPDGRKGVFHPDNFTFLQPLFLSRLYAAAYDVEGVESVKVVTFQRQGTPDVRPLQEGRLDFGRLEIARLENDSNFPDRGVFRLQVDGGK
jgi:hypothetical protein